jgi:putative ubiquitin-RnfH superfamily antitoxin RatB of RatAB toxin-antitoxin module
MGADAGKRCVVAVDTASGPLLCTVELKETDDLDAALQCACRQLGEAVADWSKAAVGIWGQPCKRSTVPAAGDRIELYRPLGLDPRQRRRQRARAAAPSGTRRVNSKVR